MTTKRFKILDVLVLAEYSTMITGGMLYRAGVTKYGRPYLYMVTEAKNLKEEIQIQVSEVKKNILPKVVCYDAKVKIYAEKDFWITNEGKMSKRDLTNIFKPVEDAIAQGLGIDDRYCREVTLQKCIGDDRIICGLYRLYLRSNKSKLEELL